MTYLFISDLHLSPKHPRLVRGFLDLLDKYQHQNTQLYILGDWFNAWIGDDDTSAWLDEIVQHLQNFTQANNQIFFQAGNRDFALHEQFLDQFGGHLLPEIETLKIGQYSIRIEHGDALCTDDIAYQRFKKVIRHPVLLSILRKTPLKFRQKLAQGFRQKSQAAKEIKSNQIMDVNAAAVEKALSNADILIHGHTHRPAIHQQNQKLRIVLGDWRENNAQILQINSPDEFANLKLISWHY